LFYCGVAVLVYRATTLDCVSASIVCQHQKHVDQ
jgi:hypothetical protein